jgi:hypothetical protein
MPRMKVIVIVVFIFGKLSAQEIFHEEKIGWKDKNLQLHSFHDISRSKYAIFLENNDSIRVFLLRNPNALIRTFSFLRSDGEKILGGYIDQNKIYLFSVNESPGKFFSYILNGDDGSITQNFFGNEFNDEKGIERINAGDQFLYFTNNKKTSEFTIYKWHNQNNIDTFRFHFNNKNIWNDIFGSAGPFTIGNTFAVDDRGVPDIEMSGNKNKLYFVHDTLFLISNNNIGITKVYTFDTKEKKFTYREIKNDSVKKRNIQLNTEHGTKFIVDEEYVDNTFLRDGILYFVSAKKDRLFISISNFYTGATLQKFSVEKSDTIIFKNTPVLQEGSEYQPNTTRELYNTKQLLNKMLGAQAFISVNMDSLRIALTIGSYDRVIPGGGSFMTAGGPAGGTTFVPYRHDYQSPWTNSVHFSMLLDSQSLSHISGPMKTSINDRVKEFTKNINLAGGVEYIFEQDGRYIYIYYDKKLRSLFFTKFL